jgi:hypothetical protein
MDDLCPKCDASLLRQLSNGRIVCTCSKCGWKGRPSNSVEKNYKKNPGNTRLFLGGLLFLVGVYAMSSGLLYDTSVSDGERYSSSRIINTGKVSDRATITNIGGFLAICGSILLSSGLISLENSKREEELLRRYKTEQDDNSTS